MTDLVPDDTDRPATVGVDAAAIEHLRQVRLEDGALLIYDVDDEGAWIQSTVTVTLDAMR